MPWRNDENKADRYSTDVVAQWDVTAVSVVKITQMTCSPTAFVVAEILTQKEECMMNLPPRTCVNWVYFALNFMQLQPVKEISLWLKCYSDTNICNCSMWRLKLHWNVYVCNDKYCEICIIMYSLCTLYNYWNMLFYCYIHNNFR